MLDTLIVYVPRTDKEIWKTVITVYPFDRKNALCMHER